MCFFGELLIAMNRYVEMLNLVFMRFVIVWRNSCAGFVCFFLTEVFWMNSKYVRGW